MQFPEIVRQELYKASSKLGSGEKFSKLSLSEQKMCGERVNKVIFSLIETHPEYFSTRGLADYRKRKNLFIKQQTRNRKKTVNEER